MKFALPTYLPTYLILAICTGSELRAQGGHPPAPCHSGEKWSVRYSGASALPVGAFVHIPAGLTVVLDTETQLLGGLLIEGNLVFDHTVPSGTVHLRSAYVVVAGEGSLSDPPATLQIGCKNFLGDITWFTKHAEITLIAPEDYAPTHLTLPHNGVQWPAVMDDRFGSSDHVYAAALDRGLVIVGNARLQIYGRDRGVSWTRLTQDAVKGDPSKTLTLEDAVEGEWRADDDIVIASTDFEYADQVRNLGLPDPAKFGGHPAGYSQGEERIILTFPQPNQVTFATPLVYTHTGSTYSETFPSGTYSIEEKAEVANLTRSIVISGVDSAHSASFNGGTIHRGHVIFMRYEKGGVEKSSVSPFCEVDWTEFTNLGVEGNLGRYPFHWHMLGDVRLNGENSSLKHSSIHHSVNRFVVVHNTQYVTLEDNVGYDTIGAGFFLEDAEMDGTPSIPPGKTQHLVIKDNLGLKVDRLVPQHAIDLPVHYRDLDAIEPSVFWIQHPNCKIEGNHAAGAAGSGFYLAPDKSMSWSHVGGVSYFRNNVAHSNGQNGFNHQSRVKWDYVAGDDPAGEGLVAWKNRRYGIWWRTYGVSRLSGCTVADNKSGLYPASEGRQDAADVADPATCRLEIDDCTIFGETPNVGEYLTTNPLNHAEVAAGRSLPQTYWNFVRPEEFSEEHESAWDTLNGIESYDGQNVITNVRIAWFEDRPALPNPENNAEAAVRLTAGITQVEYNSRFAEDPRNSIDNLDFVDVDHRLQLRSTSPTQGFSMIRNTIVQDLDGSLGYGIPGYLSYRDPFFKANCAQPPFIDDSVNNAFFFSPQSVDFAQIEIDTAGLPGGTDEMTVTIRDVSGTPRIQRLDAMSMDNAGTLDWAFNASLGLYDGDPATQQTGIYFIEFENGGVPGAYEIKVQFCESAGVPAVLAIPFSGTLHGVEMNAVPLLAIGDANADLVVDARDLLVAPPPVGGGASDAYFYDVTNSQLYVKTTTVIPSSGLASVEGTRNLLIIN